MTYDRNKRPPYKGRVIFPHNTLSKDVVSQSYDLEADALAQGRASFCKIECLDT